MIRLKCEYCQQTIVEGGRVADHKDAYREHRQDCASRGRINFLKEKTQ